MKPYKAPALGDSADEISSLIATLHATGQRLEELTGGEVDTVADREGRTFLLRHAQEHLRQTEAVRQAAILDALPANVALLDTEGVVLSVNQAWRTFGEANGLQGPPDAIGANYLEICDRASAAGVERAREAAAGIVAVLAGQASSFSIEYPCHAPLEKRWFVMTVAPLDQDHLRGVVVMHVNITERKVAEEKIVHLSRVHAMLSGISAMIVRVDDREEFFKEACQIAVREGGFRMALVAMVDPTLRRVVAVASAGKDAGLLSEVERLLSSPELAPTTMVAKAIRKKEAIVSNDSKTDSRVLLGPRYAETGVRSLAVLPLIASGEAIGALALYSSALEFFREEEMDLLTTLANDIAFGLSALQIRAERERALEALRSSLKEKDVLLKEVHHRVKNNMQVITSLLRLESNRIDDHKTKAVLKDMQSRIQAMAVLHESVYRSDTFSRVDLAAYLKRLTSQMSRSLVAVPGQISFNLALDPVGLDLDQAVPCGLMVNELVSNALKHGFPNGRPGEVRIELKASGPEELQLTICDTGIGLPENFEAIRAKSLGLQLVSDLARQLGGRLRVGPGPQALFEVTFSPNPK